MRCGTWTTSLVFAAVAVLLPRDVHAGQCGSGCHTVCPSGCDFPTISACTSLGQVNDGDTCQLQGGIFHETVVAGAGSVLRSDLVISCAEPLADPCIIDGDGIRANGIDGYLGWVIEHLEIRNTRSDAITSIPSRELAAVRDCHIHDVGGMGISLVATTNGNRETVVERNRVERTRGFGIQCAPGPTMRYLVRNNVIIDAALTTGSAAINCATPRTVLEHNTVVLRDRPSVTYGIISEVARFNLVVGGGTSVSTTSESSYNIASQWQTAAFGGTGVQVGNTTISDPLFFNREDLHLRTGSPAIDAAVGSTEPTDFDSALRGGVPDVGAIEYDPNHVEVAERWPVRETISTVPTGIASPSLSYWPGVGPVAAYFENRVSSGDLVFARRQTDTSWTREVVRSINIQNSASEYNRSTDIALDPATGRPAVAWVEQAGTQRAVRMARNMGGCANGDCASAAWKGCLRVVTNFANTDIYSIALAFHPIEHFAAVATIQLSTSGYYTVYYWDESSGTGWTGRQVETGLASNYLGWGIDLDFDPVSGNAVIAYNRLSKSGTPQVRQVVIATGDVAGFVTTTIPLGSDTGPSTNQNNRISMAHAPNGDLAIAFSAAEPSATSHGYYLAERVGGAWSSAVPWDTNTIPNTIEGLEVTRGSGADLRVTYGLAASVRVATRDSGEWSYEYADGVPGSGVHVDSERTPSGVEMVGYQRKTPSPLHVMFRATGDPGGVPAGTGPPSCDDTDPCTDNVCDNALGCLHPPSSCDDNDACTADSCDPATGCAHLQTNCDDGDACTVNACDSTTGACTSNPVNCSDGNVCTDDACDAAGGCTHLPNTNACDDNNPDTSQDTCNNGACVGVPALLVTISERVNIADAIVLKGPASISVTERLGTGDTLTVRGPVVVGVVEAVRIGDGVALADGGQGGGPGDAGTGDASNADASARDASTPDGGTGDSGASDAGAPGDASVVDASAPDGGSVPDASTRDSGPAATTDGGAQVNTPDSGVAGTDEDPGSSCGCRTGLRSAPGEGVVALIFLLIVLRRGKMRRRSRGGSQSSYSTT